MRSTILIAGLITDVLIFFLLCVAEAHGQYKVIHYFGTNNGDGVTPYAGLTFDANGNLYGTTWDGGAQYAGTVFKMTPNRDGSWSESVVYSFNYLYGGANPHAPLVFDRFGNLYSTDACGTDCNVGGAVFELTGPGLARFVLLQSFYLGGLYGAGSDGVTIGHDGKLYGGAGGGQYNAGLVFRLSGESAKHWDTVLYAFRGRTDGSNPIAVTLDPNDVVYGTTYNGGPAGGGTAFRLTPNGNGGWTETTLHAFGGLSDGAYPSSGLVFDAAGSLYGATYSGGQYGQGMVFKLRHNPNDTWSESVLYAFQGGNDGVGPNGVTFDSSGNLYGTAAGGGAGGAGTIFKLTPTAIGPWIETTLYSWSGGSDGGSPIGSVTLDNAGNVYGTTYLGGQNGNGVAWEFVQ